MNIIFDFDGTIADSFETVVRIFHEMTHRTEPLPESEIERLRGMSLLHAAKELKVQPWRMPFMMIRGRRMMIRQMVHIHAHTGITELIRELYAGSHKLYITSSNSVRNIEEFLTRHEMNTEFIKIYGGVGLLDKARVLRRVLKHNRLNPNQTWYIGDEARDVEAAKRAGIKVIAVTWGYNTKDILAAHEPDALADNPEQIVKIIKS